MSKNQKNDGLAALTGAIVGEYADEIKGLLAIKEALYEQQGKAVQFFGRARALEGQLGTIKDLLASLKADILDDEAVLEFELQAEELAQKIGGDLEGRKATRDYALGEKAHGRVSEIQATQKAEEAKRVAEQKAAADSAFQAWLSGQVKNDRGFTAAEDISIWAFGLVKAAQKNGKPEPEDAIGEAISKWLSKNGITETVERAAKLRRAVQAHRKARWEAQHSPRLENSGDTIGDRAEIDAGKFDGAGPAPEKPRRKPRRQQEQPVTNPRADEAAALFMRVAEREAV